ncbi:MAG: STAS domain-containing protein [Ignavibacteria bacterium]|jgi:anti-anti-sigma factor|nr:STAS domain-containing protein [Ignavibacteria bacterium]
MLSISKITSSDPVIIKIEGRIDGLTSKQIQTEIDEILESGVKNLILDFAGVFYLSSAGIRVFINEMKKINAIGGQMFFVSLSYHILEIFNISGLSSIFKVFNSYQEITDLLNKANADTKTEPAQ